MSTADAVAPAIETQASGSPVPRTWPAWLIVLLQVASTAVSVTPSINNFSRFASMMLGPLVCLTLFVLWGLFFSRLPWRERLTVLAMALVLGIGATLVSHESMLVPIWIYGVPLMMFVVALVTTMAARQSSPWRLRWFGLALAVVWAMFPALRLEGFTGNYLPQFAGRWRESKEAHLTASGRGDMESAIDPRYSGWQPTTVEWPAFRGPLGTSATDDVTVPCDWSTTAPTNVWQIPIGAGWSSFACVSGRLFTQEQRGTQELVCCYAADSGALIWQNACATRFWDVVSGAGPRATPTYHDGKLFTYGAKAELRCLDASTGKLVWHHDLTQEVKAELPVWGFSNSPVVVGQVVIVYAGGEGDNGLLAFDRDTGEPRWRFASRGMNFSSAQPVQLAGQTLVLFTNTAGVHALDPESGQVIWSHKPRDWAGPPICQPQQIDAESVVVPLGDGIGLARLKISRASDTWQVETQWTSKQLRPSYNDFVSYEGFLYGFDQNIFTCIDAATGKRRWKQGRYGFGQVLLLRPVGQLIVLGEDGAAVLLTATPDRHEERGRFAAIAGKTWNHPIVVGDRLYVRNGEMAACFALR
ncbi:MAG: PQQ-binding-like beta-propeller repeat protein [Pirellulales bacterium]|nr:PQQ-binding-like beta-propeller repeat protein [Pirellulales bacterium]